MGKASETVEAILADIKGKYDPAPYYPKTEVWDHTGFIYSETVAVLSKIRGHKASIRVTSPGALEGRKEPIMKLELTDADENDGYHTFLSKSAAVESNEELRAILAIFAAHTKISDRKKN